MPPPFTSADDRCPSPCPGKGCRLVTREGRTTSVFCARWGWVLEVAVGVASAPCSKAGRVLLGKKIAVFPAAPSGRVAAERGWPAPGESGGVGRAAIRRVRVYRAALLRGCFGSCWGNGEQAPSCSRLPRRGGNS